MKKKSINYISLVMLTGLTLSACGGGSNSNDNQANTSTNTDLNISGKPPTTVTQNVLTLPVGEYKIHVVDMGTTAKFYSILENRKTQINTLLSEDISTLFQQNDQHKPVWNGWQEYILTKDKLYYSEKSQHPMYILKNTDSTLVLGYDVDGSGLTKTVKFKNIDLSNESVHSSKVTIDLLSSLDRVNENDSNYIKMKNRFTQLSNTFEKGAICHQYLTQQYNQPNIIFDELSGNSNETLDEWVVEQKNQNYTVVQETWAGFRVAYITNNQERNLYKGMRYRDPVVIEMNGKLHNGTYDPLRTFDYKDEYGYKDFNAGICNIYNESATNTLSRAIQSLPKN
ncbi:hypothetical protein [Acinetobacter silvestris]|uniref:Lipoprotein n=1 Tax=Acinetobacter silvestris TaxID=1977882 RepID=A0A1Y3CK39_9GAMM|nr:hypothetical protein [Acinetobacter silvestris]OTG66513.1 hypothetical protein B9T28_04495 [Acinetobacter silvestris]